MCAIVRNGRIVPLGNGFGLVQGLHPNKVDDVDIGPNNSNGLSVNHGEIIQNRGKDIRVFSAEPMFNGVSPASLLYGGANPNKVFAMQEQWKKIHRVKDDGTKYQGGGIKFAEKPKSKFPYRDYADVYEMLRDRKVNFLTNDVDLEFTRDNFNKLDIYKTKDGEVIGIPKDEAKDLDLNGFDLQYLNKDESKKLDYIGGNKDEVRRKVFKKIQPYLNIEKIASDYGVDRNLLTHTLFREGFLDNMAKEYNLLSTVAGQKHYFDDITSRTVSGFNDLGVDDFHSNMQQGLYNVRNNNFSYMDTSDINEKGRWTDGGYFNNMNDALEAIAMDMEYRQKVLKERNYPYDLNTATNAAYNMGLYHKDLGDANYITGKYTVPNYDDLYEKTINKQFGGTMNKRKKAIVGKHIEIVDGVPVETSTTYLPNPTYTSSKAPLGERIKTGLAESGIGTEGLIGLGVGAANNVIGLVSNLISAKNQKPVVKQAPVLHSTRLVDRVRPYVDSIREQAAKMAYLNDRTAASSRTRFARAQDINANKNLQETAEVNRADQASIALQNNSLLNQQNIRNQNVINATNVANENAAARTLLHNQKIQDINDSIAQFVNNGNDLINGERGILARKDARESELRNLATMFAANPYALEAFKQGNYQKALELLKQTRV